MRWIIGADEDDPAIDAVATELREQGHDVVRVGATAGAPQPWGTIALEVANRVARHDADQGLVCCYTGTGVSIAANKVPGIRAALCVDAETARGARKWNDANVLSLSLRLTTPVLAREIVRAWLGATYDGTEGASLDAVATAERGSNVR